MGSSTCITGRTRKRPWPRALNTQLDLDFNIWVSWKTGVGNLRVCGFYFFIFFNSFSFNSPPRSGLRFHSLVLKKKGDSRRKSWLSWLKSSVVQNRGKRGSQASTFHKAVCLFWWKLRLCEQSLHKQFFPSQFFFTPCST